MRSCVKAVDASSWLLALRQEDGGALRHSPSSNNWQLHVLAKPRLLCSSPRSWPGGSGGVGCCPFLAAVHSTATCLSWLICFQLCSFVR